MYQYILFPGRHHAITKFQFEYLRTHLEKKSFTTLAGNIETLTRSPQVIWAITSANHSNTRRNPVPGYRRLSMLEVASLSLPVATQSYLVPNRDFKKDFAHYLIEEIYLQSRGRVKMTPDNTLVACSTPSVIEQYEKLGYKIVPVELKDIETGAALSRRPWDVVEEIIRSGAEWRSNGIVIDELQPDCLEHFERYGLGDLIVEIHQDPLVSSSDGDITETRDYQTYRAAFEDNAFRKVDQFAPFVRPGRILDIGCATGQTLKLLAEVPELFESDFYGVEAARPLFEICEQRKSNGEFGNANVFFYQRNIMRSTIFPSNSLNTAITMALTHEIESYLGRDSLLEFLRRMYDMLAPGGVYINFDVSGPAEKDDTVYVQFTEDDGENPSELFPELDEKGLSEFLMSLSTKSRFLRFAKDFRAEEGDQMSYDTEQIDGQTYFTMRNADLCDFLAKKDYHDSWHSEMHERFCFWNFDDWTAAVKEVGFEVHEASKPIQNPWLIENRFAPAAKVFHKNAKGELEPMPSPDTNIMLVAQKPQ